MFSCSDVLLHGITWSGDWGPDCSNLQELIALARAQMPVPFREDGPHLVYEFDDPPIVHISEEGAVTYADEEAAPKRKRVDGDDEESARKRRASAGLKGSARTVSYRVNLPDLGMPAVKHSLSSPHCKIRHQERTGQ